MGSFDRLPRMQIAPVFDRAFRRIYGKPCWGVRPGHGSFLTFEFGKPHLEVREPIVASKGASARVRESLGRRLTYVRGEWHLWIYCCNWEVPSHGKRIADSSTKRKTRVAADVLNGQKLLGVSIVSRKVHSVFKFDLGATLRTWPLDHEREQWLLYEPSKQVLVLRADGRYEHREFVRAWHSRGLEAYLGYHFLGFPSPEKRDYR